ncbi:palmitoyl-acyl carrier protein thioesterase, chloroplastic-like isoform X1 [Euphorbia lathyris]|uniref:palmitoyl-acyl carrier protein thioesterase, chloroplastic-like isoform X1 n=1 Tax=Euphorbia lathyris TaxID=212925 RepID=UPI0033140392
MASATACGSLIFNKNLNSQEIEKINTTLSSSSSSSFSKIQCNKMKKLSCRAGTAMEEMQFVKSKSNDFRVGRLVEDGLVYCQNLTIKSFEIGFDRKASIAALMSYLQDSAINHGRITGIMADGHILGVTREMSKKDLIWVLSSLQIVVDRYPSWLDVVQVETWMYPLGKNGLGHDWVIRDRNTGDVLAQATSQFVLMNKKTRKLSKFSDKVKEELAPHMMEYSTLILNNIIQKPSQLNINTTDFSCTELKVSFVNFFFT